MKLRLLLRLIFPLNVRPNRIREREPSAAPISDRRRRSPMRDPPLAGGLQSKRRAQAVRAKRVEWTPEARRMA